MRLDGMGGTITVTDQIKKVFDLTEIPITLIIRKYKELFQQNSYIKEVIEVGYDDNNQILTQYKDKYDILCDIRFIVGKWYYKDKITPLTDINFSDWEVIYNRHPDHRDFICKASNDIDKYNLNQTQIVDMSLGLPYSTIDSKIYIDKIYNDTSLPKKFILINNGVDIQHESMRQTKQWDYWRNLIPLLTLPTVQVGSINDKLIENITYDLRGKTDLLQLIYLMKKSTLILCCEGGIMHLAYSIDCNNIVVLRGPSSGPINKYPNQTTIDSFTCDNCWWTTNTWYVNCPLKLDCICMKSISPERVAYTVGNLC
jgi:hypothetical protein